jgi:OOP family OmpA-OmpF porin/outer membrane immunogenic protein
MRKALVLGVLGLAGALASPAYADDPFRGWRLGAWVGQESFESNVDYIGYFDDVDENRLSYGVFGGWGLNKWLAAEVGFHDGGEFNAHILSDGAFPTRNVEMHTDVRGFEASIVGSWWITNDFSLYGRAGIYVWKGEATFTEDLDPSADPPASRETFEDDGNEPFFGVGVQTELDGALVRLEYQMVETGDFEAPGLEMLDNSMESLNLSIVWFIH